MAYTFAGFSGVTTLEDLIAAVEVELRALSDEAQETISLELRPVYVAPDKPREGMIVCADGTSWNPGSGAGAYEYRGGAWQKL